MISLNVQRCSAMQAVCTLTRLSLNTVNAIIVNAVERGMLRRTKEEIFYLGIDERIPKEATPTPAS
jgi:transposase